MKSIETKYHGPTNTKGSRISASDCEGRGKLYVHYDDALDSAQNHREAAIAWLSRHGQYWPTGTLYGGHTQYGMAWHHADSDLKIEHTEMIRTPAETE